MPGQDDRRNDAAGSNGGDEPTADDEPDSSAADGGPDSSAADGGPDSSAADDGSDGSPATTVESDGVTASYFETAEERILAFEREKRAAAIAQNREGYAMLKVRPAPDGDELERYYGFDMALDHAAELLGTRPGELPVPDQAADMGM